MSKIPSEVIDDIRERTNIVEIVGQYVQLKKAGRNYSGLCPFHSEKTPSFTVAEDKQIFHCFGCGKGGNVFRFIQEIEGVSFAESVVKVADLEQIELQETYRHQTATTPNKETSPLYVLHDKAMQFYHHMLVNTEVGQAALTYLHDRGLTDELIEEFQIGFAPPQREFLERIFEKEAASREDLLNSGLFIERDDGRLLDRFYQRIMFPIRNSSGRTIAFSGRWFELSDEKSDQAKYLNSPETPIFNKRMVLFNLDKAKSSIRKDGTVYLFEGFMDVIAAFKTGLESGVASMGTSLTNQQIQQLERVATNLVFCYDGDDAGQQATARGLELLREHSRLNLSVVRLGNKLDPDEFIQANGADAFRQLVEHEQQTPFSFTADFLAKQYNLQNEKERVTYLELVLKELATVDSLIEQDQYVSQLAERFQLQRTTLTQQVQLYQREHKPAALPIKPTIVTPVRQQKKTLAQKAQELLLYRMMQDSSYRSKFKQEDGAFLNEQYQALYILLDTYCSTQETFEVARFLDFLKEDGLRTLVLNIFAQNVSEEGSSVEFRELMKQLQLARIGQEIEEKKHAQQRATQQGNNEQEIALAIEIIALTKQLKQIQVSH
ncbi:DNA primase [Enterococcus sp. AZ150]|uniref:DNA primase n=1 Tax=Enterococcus sp. AZ150 TaxID=2774866 RepID=UPI003F218E7E